MFNNLAEKARITAAGGFVDFGRVNGIVEYSVIYLMNRKFGIVSGYW
jgi:hypothetical protein